MKKLITSLLLLAFIAGAAVQAQTPDGPTNKAKGIKIVDEVQKQVSAQNFNTKEQWRADF